VVKGIVRVFCPQIPRLYLHDEGEGDAVVALVLRFALNARPTGSQGSAPGKGNDKKQEQRPKEKQEEQKTEKGDILNEVRKGTF
jgi:hypothetical protein